ncbi:DUF86 domain-containing protein [Alkalihalobacterium chitinilyticum]|uniref:DUF86 domain-containing protein n=1 Tax=Alkalihalobacterium chitinilyticum TaxID=2980103 RepID=A0ABT5VIQ2_9BACI|nr:DUF86 domain-containing protein [Alkalihalobacterium chitinilyticum]MDE5415325.1 DUF86 domain-containing protein [Alkalihalobacterium chitinilyticum]
MYFVDREKIENTLTHIEVLLSRYRNQSTWESDIEKLALERIGHNLIESIIDVGNAMIDGFIMRDPGSYEDIIDILEDEKVVDASASEQLRHVIRFRKPLVQAYVTVDHSKLLNILEENVEAIEAFPGAVRHYLEAELGPVSAFLPKE